MLLPGTRTSDNTVVTSSSGNSVTVIPLELPYVLQAFCYRPTYLRIKDFWTHLCNHRLTEFVAPIYDFIDPICAIRVKKVRPISDFDSPKMHSDIREAIYALGEASLCHGDVRLDNIGYSESRYVLYDYDSVRVGADIHGVWKDLSMFEDSIRYRRLA